MLFSEKTLRKLQKIISNTPLNRNFIAGSALKRRIKETSPYVKGIALDVGCGEKPYEYLFKGLVDQYVGMDLPNSHFFYSPDRHADVYGHSCNLPFKSSSIDTIICTEVLPHIDKPYLAFAEFARVLKSGGILVLTANKSWERRTGLPIPDYWRFTDEALALLTTEQNLEVIYTKTGCGFFATIGQLLCRFLNKEFIYRKAQYHGIDKQPYVLIAFFIIPLIAFIQILFLVLDKLYYSKLDTLFYILVARKAE
jgi:SAM-dependent methyltransferase